MIAKKLTDDQDNDAYLCVRSIKNYINFVEGIFYDDKELHNIDYAKIDVNSAQYDKEYDNSIRNKKLDVFYCLDDVLTVCKARESASLKKINHIETYIFSTTFSRDILRERTTDTLIKNITDLCRLLKQDTLFLDTEISSTEYAGMRCRQMGLCCPENKADLTNHLIALHSFFEDMTLKLKTYKARR